MSTTVTNGIGRGFYDPEGNDLLNSPETVLDALNIICDFAFPDENVEFDSIYVHGNCVSFCISNRQYALVYSPDTPPCWIVPTEQENVITKSFNNGWYHVIKDN